MSQPSASLLVRLVTVSLLIAGLGLTQFARAEGILEVYRLALKNDAFYAAAKFQYAAATEAMPQAKAGLLPSLAFEAERIETKQDIVSSDNIFYANGNTSFPTNNLTLSLSQPVFRYGSWVGYKQSKIAVQQAEAELAVAQQKLLLDVAAAYFDVLAAQDNLDYARAEMAAVQSQLETTKVRSRTGNARKTDLYDAQARFSLSESREIEAQVALDDSYLALQEFTNQNITQLQPVRDDMPLTSPEPTDPGHWIDAALEQNLTLQVRRQAVEVANHEIKIKKSGHMPTLDLVARFNQRDTEGSLLGGGSEIETTDYLLRFNLPLYQGGSVRSKMRQAINMRDKSSKELEAEIRRVRRETRSAYMGVLSGINKVRALKDSTIAQNSTLAAKKSGLSGGLNTLLEVLDAQRDLYFSQSDYSRARYDYLLSALKLKQSIGSLSTADLDEINDLLK